jgi:hypothetical protein
MIKEAGLRFIAFGLCITICSSLCAANQQVNHSRKKTVDAFLQTWLVRKDVPAALRFFHSRAFSNASVLNDSCPGEDYIPDSEQNNPKAVRRGVSKFLKDSSHHIKGSNLGDILFLISPDNPQQSIYLSGQLKKISFNRPERDKYYLASLDAVKSRSKPDDDWAEFEKRYNLRNAFVSVIQYRVLNEDERYGDDIVMMFLWVKVGVKWKIVFAAVPSCSA